MIAVAFAGMEGEGFVELLEESIQVLDFEGGEIDPFTFKELVQGGQHPSYRPDAPPGELPGLAHIEQVGLIDVGQADLVVWNGKGLGYDALVVQVGGEAAQGMGCLFKTGVFSKLSEGLKGEHIVPANPLLG